MLTSAEADLGRRIEGDTRDPKHEFRDREELRCDRQITVGSAPGTGGETFRDFFLNHDVDFIYSICKREEVMKDR